jgi:hypothetical protein
MGYTEAQLAWTEEYLAQVYGKMLPDFFKSDREQITRYIMPGPTTPGFNREQAPDRLGVYLGWQVVRRYMDQQPDKTLADLLKMEQSAYREIFQQSGYKPTA